MTTPRTGYPYLDEVLVRPGSVLAFAHRGGAYHPEIEGLENTLAAFEHAVALGYDYLETDVHVTRDGVLLAFHDAVLDRVTDRKGEIARLSYDEVRTAVIGGRAEIPTLAVLFDAFPDVRFNIDIKSEGAVSVLADFINAREAWDRVLVGSFSRTGCSGSAGWSAGRCRRRPPPSRWCSSASCRAPRLADLLTPDFDAFQVPHRHGRLLVTTAGLVRRAHARGKQVHVWTIDKPDEMHELLDLGVDGLFTDRTDLLKDVLIARGQWRGPGKGEGNPT